MIFNNRKGHLPTYLLVIVALALSTTALLALASSDRKVNLNSEEIDSMLSEVDFGQEYVKRISEIAAEEAVKKGGDAKQNFVEIAAERDLRIDSAGNFFGKVRNREFSFEKEGETYVLKVGGLFVQAERRNNKIKRNFAIEMRFNKDGKVIL